MSFDVAPIGQTSFNAAPDSAVRRTPAVRDAATISSGEIPDGPPPEVLEAMNAAGRVLEQLHEQGRELRFGQDPDGGRVTIEVCDLDGNVLRSIPPSRMLEIAAGAPVN